MGRGGSENSCVEGAWEGEVGRGAQGTPRVAAPSPQGPYPALASSWWHLAAAGFPRGGSFCPAGDLLLLRTSTSASLAGSCPPAVVPSARQAWPLAWWRECGACCPESLPGLGCLLGSTSPAVAGPVGLLGRICSGCIRGWHKCVVLSGAVPGAAPPPALPSCRAGSCHSGWWQSCCFLPGCPGSEGPHGRGSSVTQPGSLSSPDDQLPSP